ncbi:MAG: hypothetical protein AMS27_01445 [Bacteroides sp. SM23_62_1]|nr:MAG: hypothetical protein AMS27_01445 [Bacteroides sp. SM23_62_1]
MQKTVIIVAGGKGTRLIGKTPKQFLEIAEKPVLMHSFECFYRYDNSIYFILALHPDYLSTWKALMKKHYFTIKHEVVHGGGTRFHSVLNALDKTVKGGWIAVHDAVRPLVSRDTIDRCFEAAREKGCAVPCIGINESVRELIPEGSKYVDRQKLKLIQTPQVFRSDIIKDAYRQTYMEIFTDDASVVEHAGYSITLVEGNSENIKITTPQDVFIAEALMKSKRN